MQHSAHSNEHIMGRNRTTLCFERGGSSRTQNRSESEVPCSEGESEVTGESDLMPRKRDGKSWLG